MKISFGCDHAGYAVKADIVSYLRSLGHVVVDFGTFSDQSCDYPDYAYKAAKAVAAGDCALGILICGTGLGISIAANKVKGIRCAHCESAYVCRMSRSHNDCNMLALGARTTSLADMKNFIDIFLTTPHLGGNHTRRVQKLSQIEDGNDPSSLN